MGLEDSLDFYLFFKGFVNGLHDCGTSEASLALCLVFCFPFNSECGLERTNE